MNYSPNYSPLTNVIAIGLLMLAVLGSTATTILGWIAVAQIRRSAGKLRGMMLAVFSGLLFPLLLLDLLIAGVGMFGLRFIVVSAHAAGQPTTLSAAYVLLPLASLVVIAVVDMLIIRRVWRAVNAPAGSRPNNDTPTLPRKSYKWLAIGCAVIALLAVAWFVSGQGRFYPASSLSNAYKAPVIGRIHFEVPDLTSKTGTSYDVKAWGDTQWSPLYAMSAVLFRTRVDASRSTYPVAWVTTYTDNKNWETRKVDLGAETSTQTLTFSNGSRVTVSWTPYGDPDPKSPRPTATQQQVMRRASEKSDQMHPVSTASAPLSFGPVIEQIISLKDYINFQSGTVLSRPARECGEKPDCNEPARVRDWQKHTGADAFAYELSDNVPRLFFALDGYVADESEDTFNTAQAARGDARLNVAKESIANRQVTSPTGLYWFTSHDGAKGVLELIGASENPPGVKIRYKLVQDTKDGDTNSTNLPESNSR